MEYCRWLSEKTGKAYRLPTEAEWEWACRAGTDDRATIRPSSTTTPGTRRTPTTRPHQVGKKKPNAWGLHDMHGNVAEWCLDAYKKDFYSTLPRDKPFVLPFNPPTEKRYSDVVRGGSWNDRPPTNAAAPCGAVPTRPGSNATRNARKASGG